MIHAGMGPTHVNEFLSCLNIPPVSHSMLDNRKDEAGRAIETVAKESCKEKANLEREMEAQRKNISQEELASVDYLDIAVTYDMMWMKRGRAHNSLTGGLFIYLFIYLSIIPILFSGLSCMQSVLL